jgi:hypothetical protein
MFTPKKIIAEETQRFEDPFRKTKYIYISLYIYKHIMYIFVYRDLARLGPVAPPMECILVSNPVGFMVCIWGHNFLKRLATSAWDGAVEADNRAGGQWNHVALSWWCPQPKMFVFNRDTSWFLCALAILLANFLGYCPDSLSRFPPVLSWNKQIYIYITNHIWKCCNESSWFLWIMQS